MIIKNFLERISIIFILIVLFPLVQKQWLNLYLFDINNFTIYKLLYYLSGLIYPILVIIYSLNNFTFYKFNKKINTTFNISGKSLLFLASIILIILSILISSYIFINLRIFFNLFINNNFFVQVAIDKKIFFVVVTSILLLFKKIRVLIKKIVLINFFIMSILLWYLQISNIVLNDVFFIDILNFENTNFFNILFILAIEKFYYLWSYISYGSYLSDWKLPWPNKSDLTSILNIIIFYLFIILYYTILFK